MDGFRSGYLRGYNQGSASNTIVVPVIVCEVCEAVLMPGAEDGHRIWHEKHEVDLLNKGYGA